MRLELDFLHIIGYSQYLQEISSKMSLVSLINKLRRIGLRLHPFLNPVVVGNARIKSFCNYTLNLFLFLTEELAY